MPSGAGDHAFHETQAGAACADCGSTVSGNFCSACGADLRGGGSGLIDTVTGGRQSYLATYLQILRSPVKATVDLTDDPSYRQHISFLLSSLAVFCVIMVPFIVQSAVADDQLSQFSESMRTLISVMSQVGVYVGAVITFLLGYGLFRVFAKETRSLKSYFKLYCLAYGFMLPPYALYDYVARGLLGITGLSSFAAQTPTVEELATVPFAVSFAVSLLIWVYFIAIHRRFWRMPVWKATVLFSAAAIAAGKIGYEVMYVVGAQVAMFLINLGVVQA
jgi:hypothetical protein